MPKPHKTPPPTLAEIRQTLRGQLPALQEGYKVKSLGVFGSYVRGENKPSSDLDLLVEFEQARYRFPGSPL